MIEREKYFTNDLKEERTSVDQKTDQVIVTPSREDSYERLMQIEKQFVDNKINVEDDVITRVMVERLRKALHTLTKEEKENIYALFFLEISVIKLAKQYDIARTTLQSKKYKILEKLKRIV